MALVQVDTVDIPNALTRRPAETVTSTGRLRSLQSRALAAFATVVAIGLVYVAITITLYASSGRTVPVTFRNNVPLVLGVASVLTGFAFMLVAALRYLSELLAIMVSRWSPPRCSWTERAGNSRRSWVVPAVASRTPPMLPAAGDGVRRAVPSRCLAMASTRARSPRCGSCPSGSGGLRNSDHVRRTCVACA